MEVREEWIFFLFFFFFFLFFFYGHTCGIWKVPRLGVKSEVHLPATAIAMLDPSRICNLHCSAWQYRVLNPLNETRDQTHILMDANRVYNLLSHNGTPEKNSLLR